MAMGSIGSFAPPALWLPAPLFCPRLPCRPPSRLRGGSLHHPWDTHGGGAPLISASGAERRELATGHRSRSYSADKLRTAASLAGDAASAPHGRRQTARHASATAVCDRPSAQAEESATQPAQYPWAVHPTRLSPTPRRPSGVGRQGVAAHRQSRAPLPSARGSDRAQTDAERLAQTVRRGTLSFLCMR